MNNTYQVRFIDQELGLTGRGDSDCWQVADTLSDFQYPWLDAQAPKTEFRALFSNAFFYFMFAVDDPVIESKLERIDKMKTIDCERVELFFSIDADLSCYFPLEIDPLGRVLDARAQYHRKIDFDWQWPVSTLQLHTHTNTAGYIVEGAISLAALTELDILKTCDGHQYIRVGVFRAHYEMDQSNQREARWISWVQPNSVVADFHIPSAFGQFDLVRDNA